MDVRTSIRGRLPGRQPTAGVSTNTALRQPAIAREGDIKFAAAEIFKKTPCVADLKPRGRFVAKDLVETAGIPFLLRTLLGFDADVGTLNVKLTDAELAERKTKWKPRATNHTSGALWKYAQQVGPAVDGAVTHPGGAHEKQCYADI
jgi:dihydroxyacid dehydratase/phosphogluconate dehydratase